MKIIVYIDGFNLYYGCLKNTPYKWLDINKMCHLLFPNDMFNYNCELWLFKSTTLLINWHEEVAIEITNQSMTPFLRDMFEFVKAGGRKIDHNKVIRGVLERV